MLLEEKLYLALKNAGKKISFAESCTGGMVSARLVGVAGSSEVFDGAVCSYANSVKQNLLGVNESVLNTKGAVSADCALQMAKGVLKLFGADIAVAVTGIAGPSGGTPQKPVGTVYICCAKESGAVIKHFHFNGNRQSVRNQAANQALILALKNI